MIRKRWSGQIEKIPSGFFPPGGKKQMPMTAVAFLVVLLDQAGKFWARRWLTDGCSLPVLPGIFELRLIYNSGAAFGILARQRMFLIFLAVVCLAATAVFYSRLKRKTFWWRLGTGLLAGGITGDLIDRLKDGVVTDFLHFSFPPFSVLFQTFNPADAGIFFGALIFVFQLMRDDLSRAGGNGAGS